MPRRRRSRGRVSLPRSLTGRVAPRLEMYDDNWLDSVVNNPSIRFVDLTRIEDRRRYDPTSVDIRGKKFESIPKTLKGTPARIVVVPEGHRLARLQTYGGRFTIADVLKGYKYVPGFPRGWNWHSDPGLTTYSYENYPSRRVGFALPWQVVICVRRKRRREVLHAMGKTGKGQAKQKPSVRNYYSNVRC